MPRVPRGSRTPLPIRTGGLSVLLTAVALLGAACSGGSAPPPKPVDASTLPTRWPIKHVIYIIKENRTFDQFFGLFPGANGAIRGRDGDRWRALKQGVPDKLVHDIKHDHTTANIAYDGGTMDGFAWDKWSNRYAYSVAKPADIPNYWRWAHQFVLSDNFFSSMRGPSFPNHLYAIAANPAGTFDNPKRIGMHGAQWTWGCDAPPFTKVEVRRPKGETVLVPPCFTMPTMGDLLNQKGIPWTYYAATIEQAGYIWSAYDAIDQVRNTELWERHVKPVDNLVSDIRYDRLPPVTWVTPRFEVSDHPDYSLCHGENWTTTVINAVMHSSMWKDTAIFLTWDDWGGFYDHVRPPAVAGEALGFRVPLMVLSPYALRGHVDHRLSEFSTVLRFIEDNWKVTPLTHRDGAPQNLSYDFDFSQRPRPPDPLPLRTDCKGPAFTLPLRDRGG